MGAALTTSLIGQQGVNEIGFSAGVQANFAGGDESVSIAVPGGSMRWGVFWDDRNSLEAGWGVQWTDVGDGNDVVGNASLAILHHFSAEYMQSRPFVAVGGGWSYFDVAGISGDQFSLGASVGYAMPINVGVGVRFVAGYSYAIENDDFSDGHAVGASIGISAFIGRDRLRRSGR